MSNIFFTAIDWSAVARMEHKGTTGTAWWQTHQFPGLRIRLVEYSANYFANHWCEKGHIVHCLEGEFVSEQSDGSKINFTKGMSYVVSNDLSSHRSLSETDVKLIIIDGDFLKHKKDL